MDGCKGIKSFMVHAHGSHDDCGTCLVPQNCMVYMLNERDSFTYDEGFTNNIWHFSLSDVHDRLAGAGGGQKWGIGDALMEFVSCVDEINGHMKNKMSWFAPGQLVNNVSFNYNDKSFWPGCFELPMAEYVADREVLKKVRELCPDAADFHAEMDGLINPSTGRLEFELTAEGWSKAYSKPPTLRELLSRIEHSCRHDDFLNIIFVMTCRNTMKSKRSLMDARGMSVQGWHAKQLIVDVCLNMVDYSSSNGEDHADLSMTLVRSTCLYKRPPSYSYIVSEEDDAKRLRVE